MSSTLILLDINVIEEILSRLTVKSLLRFRCVSKEWRSLIDSKQFVKIHLRNSIANEKVLLFPRTYHADINVYICPLPWFLNEPNDLALELTQVKCVTERGPVLVGCCNGLVCVLSQDERFIVWNPSTRISKELPDIGNGMVSIDSYGFGWNELTGDYKVFATARFRDQGVVSKIYSLSSDSWRRLDYFDILPFHTGQGLLVSGKLHWWSCDKDTPKILALHLQTEAFEIFEAPPSCKSLNWPCLRVLGDYLIVQDCLDTSECSFIEVKKKHEMNDYWEKVIVTDQMSPSMAPVCVRADNGIMTYEGKYCISTAKVEHYVCNSYVESLVSPI